MRSGRAAVSGGQRRFSAGGVPWLLAATIASATVAAQAPTDADIDDYTRGIAELEALRGPFDAGLAEQLLGLGRARTLRGDHPGALAAYERAWQIQRVNFGLHDPAQIPAFARVLEARRALDDWQGLNDGYHYLTWVYRRSYGTDDPRAAPGYLAAARWHMRAPDIDPVTEPWLHYAEASEFYARVVGATAGEFDADTRVALLFESAQADMRAASGAQAAILAAVDDYVTPDQSVMFDSRLRQLQYVVQRSYQRGSQTVDQALAEQQARTPAQPGALAAALALRGDWHLMFNRYQSARDSYRQAAQAITSDPGVAPEAAAAFLQPRPAFRLPVPEPAGVSEPAPIAERQSGSELAGAATNGDAPAPPAGERRTRISLLLDVTARGRVRNVRVTGSDPVAPQAVARTASAWVEQTRFRPRLGPDGPELAKDVSYAYVLVERDVHADAAP